MSILQVGGVLIAGLSILTVGISKKRKWLILTSIILLLIVLWQAILLLGMAT